MTRQHFQYEKLLKLKLSFGRSLSVVPCVIVETICCASCSRTSTSYDRLCRIYEGFDGKPNTSEIAVEISNTVGQTLPDIYADYHVVLSTVSNERYEMFRMLARERANQNDWVCDAIRRRYPPDAPP